jgi:hypothetical protein
MGEKIYRDPIELRKKAEDCELGTIFTGTLTAIFAYGAVKLNVDVNTGLKDAAVPEMLAGGAGSSLGGVIITALRAASYRRRADALETQIVLTEKQSQETAPQAL